MGLPTYSARALMGIQESAGLDGSRTQAVMAISPAPSGIHKTGDSRTTGHTPNDSSGASMGDSAETQPAQHSFELAERTADDKCRHCGRTRSQLMIPCLQEWERKQPIGPSDDRCRLNPRYTPPDASPEMTVDPAQYGRDAIKLLEGISTLVGEHVPYSTAYCEIHHGLLVDVPWMIEQLLTAFERQQPVVEAAVAWQDADGEALSIAAGWMLDQEITKYRSAATEER